MTLRFAVVTLIAAASVLTGCSSEKTAATTSSPSLSRATASNAPTRQSTSASREQKSVEEQPERLVDIVGFTSPSGAIGCMLDDNYVRCDVREHSWALPPRPAVCEFDYGQGISMSTGEQAEIVCAGDTTLGVGDPLPYGQSVTVGPLNCQSAETGVTCRDASSGHGFTVAREAYSIF